MSASRSPSPRAPVLPASRAPWWILPLFALVLIVLFGQLVLRQTRSEPFPTFLLPGGASLYHTDADGIVYQRTDYYAVGLDGTERQVPLEAILPGVPPSYHKSIVRDDFGLLRPGPRRGPIHLGPLRIPVTGGVITREEIEETKAWLRPHAEAASGQPVAALRVVRQAYRLRPFTKSEKLLRTVSDDTLSLLPRPRPTRPPR